MPGLLDADIVPCLLLAVLFTGDAWTLLPVLFRGDDETLLPVLFTGETQLFTGEDGPQYMLPVLTGDSDRTGDARDRKELWVFTGACFFAGDRREGDRARLVSFVGERTVLVGDRAVLVGEE